MKKILLLAGIAVTLAACGSEEEPTEETSAEGENNTEQTEEPSSGEQSEDEADAESTDESENSAEEGETETAGGNKVGDTISNEIGESTLVSLANDVGTFETGSIVLTIEKVNGVSMELNAQGQEMLDKEELEYIQVDVSVENTSEDTVNFYADQATITTDSGEQIDMPDMMMSDHLGGEFIGQVSKEGTLIYPLEQSNAEDVNSVRILIDAPSDNDLNTVGEEIDTEVQLEK
ncbi:hypothetical protein [Salibacterium sp. K-3]